MKDSHLSQLSSLPKLEEMSLDSCAVRDWSIAHFAENDFANLTCLDLADTDISDLGMPHLATFNLCSLSLFYYNISDNGPRLLTGISTLEVLNLDSRDIGDEGLLHLRNLRNLKSLDFFSRKVTDIACAHILKIIS